MRKKNPLKNLQVMLKLNPHAKTVRRAAILTSQRQKKAREAQLEKKRSKK